MITTLGVFWAMGFSRTQLIYRYFFIMGNLMLALAALNTFVLLPILLRVAWMMSGALRALSCFRTKSATRKRDVRDEHRNEGYNSAWQRMYFEQQSCCM